MNCGIEKFEDLTREKILEAIELIRPDIASSPLKKVGNTWAKFECKNPTGAFKVRGGLTYFHWLKTEHPSVKTAIAATRGNHGQSVAFAAGKSGIACKIIVPHGNSASKNEAMRKLGAEVIEHGRDFADAMAFGAAEAEKAGAHYIPSFDWKLVLGVSTYGFELFSELPDLETLFVPIGLGSGICGTIAARNALGLNTKIIGVVAENAPAYADSLKAGHLIESSEIPETIADGVALRIPHPESFFVIQKHVDSILQISEAEIKTAIRELHENHGHRVEGAGALGYAAHKKHGDPSQKSAFIISGGNIDDDIFENALGANKS